jgi:putative transposase
LQQNPADRDAPWLSRIWLKWRASLLTVKPDTVIGWHRKGIRLFWTKLSRRKIGGRPSASSQITVLIKQITHANPLWGAPRIYGELLKLGINISERIVSRLMPKNRKPPSQTWRTLLDNHFQELVSIDFLTVPTATFRMLYVICISARSPARRSLQCDCASDGRLDRAADDRSLS